MREAARLGAIEHDKRNKPTKVQRVGRVALGGVANSIILAHNTKLLTKGAGSLLGGDTYAAIAKRGESLAPRLRQRHEARQNVEGVPTRLRRLGNLAVKASAVAAEAITRRSTKRAAQLHEKSKRLERDFTEKRGEGHLVSAARAYKADRADQKHKVQTERQKAANEAVSKYRTEHPEIAERERKEAETATQHEAMLRLSDKQDWIVECFQNGRDVGSFSKSIPRRPSYEGERGFTGDYTELAKTSLTSALAHKSEDGTIPLLGGSLQREHLAELKEQGHSVYAASKAEVEYTDGVSTALWQLGFVQFDDEKHIPYGRGHYNPDIEWEQSENSVTARIPFDATNELHQMLAPENAGEGQMIELEMSQREHGHQRQAPYMNMRVVEAVPRAVAA